MDSEPTRPEFVPAGFTLGPEIGGRPGRTRVYMGLDPAGNTCALKTVATVSESPVDRLTDNAVEGGPTTQSLANARFAAECAVHRRTNGCAHVLPLHSDMPDGWLITQWAHGGTLAEWIDRCGAQHTATLERVLSTVVALLEACACMHARGVVHRDIKPSNVLLDGNDLWLADFGLAAGLDEDGVWRALPAPWTETEIGTYGWSAPELAAVPPLTQPANDVYSVGRVWEALNRLCDEELAHHAALRHAILFANPVTRPTAEQLLQLLR